jgi:hypothetical protein
VTPVDEPRRLLLFIRHVGALRNHYAEVVAALSGSGVAISVCYESAKDFDRDALERIAPGVRLVGRIAPTRAPRERLARRLRHLVDLLRYEHPDYAESGWLRNRAIEDAPPGIRRWSARLAKSPRRAAAASRLLLALDRILPPVSTAVEIIERERPDAVVVSPAVWYGSIQVDFLKAAAERGISTGIWIPSWDNLTNKGLLRFAPDRVFVWNEMQREELVRYHSVPAERAVVTGAQTFDRWFTDCASSTRSAFCARVGLDPERPFILYLGSSFQIAPDEPAFFERWLAAVRGSGDPALQQAGVLVRPHPTANVLDAWEARRVESAPGVAMASPDLDLRYGQEFYDDYRDAFRHCAVAVGINTSAMVEAAIFGVPVCTPCVPELKLRQHGTLHFRLLETAGGGLLHTASTLEEHAAQLSEFIHRDPTLRDEKTDGFVTAFVRPHGIDTPAAPIFVGEMLALLGRPTEVAVPTGFERRLGRVLAWLALPISLPLEDEPIRRSAALLCLRWAVLARAAGRALRRLLWVAAGARRSARLRAQATVEEAPPRPEDELGEPLAAGHMLEDVPRSSLP